MGNKIIILLLKSNLPNIVPIVELILRLMAPPDNESKLALNAQAQALVPKIIKKNEKRTRKNLKTLKILNILKEFYYSCDHNVHFLYIHLLVIINRFLKKNRIQLY